MELWLRLALGYTTAMNVIGGLAFTPFFAGLQRWAGLPPAPDLYLWIVSSIVVGMGLVYGWMAVTNTPNKPLLVLACYGKASFALSLMGSSLVGETPGFVALLGVPDALLAILFAAWLIKHR